MEILIAILVVLLLLIAFLYIQQLIKYKKYYARYKDIIDVDNAISLKKKELVKLKKQSEKLETEYQSKNKDLSKEYQEKRTIYMKLLKEISTLEEDLEFTTYGVYKPHFDFDTSDKYKEKLVDIRKTQKEMIKDKIAIICHTEWQVEGSKAKGKKMVNEAMKLMLRAFNNECDAAVLKVKWNNINKMEERVEKAFDAINKLGATNHINVTDKYLELKLDELHLAHEYQEKIYEEKEEQKRIREEMREEEKIQKEIEEAQKEAELEEKRYLKALDKARKEMETAKGEELDNLKKQLAEFEIKLQEAQEIKERAKSRAQETKSGHVYIISNIGSFGNDVYKIGMTRRLEPIERVNELSGASVPFQYDVHAMIFSENAPEMENTLHKELEEKRVNMINRRKEFFRVSLDDIASVVKKYNGQVEITKMAEAKEYRETLSIIESSKETMEQAIEKTFPSNL
ncbi:MAG: DUF4041 domain-containing protein [Spirochaetota bacterium]|nr:DUF4041 domain-containing protein [Spirochaetota bacterium]